MKTENRTTLVSEESQFFVQSILQANQIRLDGRQWMLLQKWVTMLLEANQKINLISRKDTARIWENHVLHSLALLAVIEIPENAEVCDIGTGGGLPGIALAIACPHARFTLIDGIEKKIRAVQSMLAKLAIPNAGALTSRAEQLAEQSFYQNRFSVLTARTVAPLKSLEKWTGGLRAPGAVLHAYKGGDLRHELADIARNIRVSKVVSSPLALKGTSFFEQNQKRIVSLYF